MSSSRSGRPWTRGKASAGDGGGAGRPLTRGRQRGYYSEIVGAEAVKKIGGSIKQGPKAHHSTVWKIHRGKHLPSVAKFDPPEDFFDQLNAQVYGPSTQLIRSDVVSSKSWDPKVHIPFKMDSGRIPEIEI